MELVVCKRKAVKSLSNIYYLVKIGTFFNLCPERSGFSDEFCNIILNLGYIENVWAATNEIIEGGQESIQELK